MCGVVWMVVSLASVCCFPEWVHGLLLEDTERTTSCNTLWVTQSFRNPAQLCQEGFCCCGAQACPALFFRGRAGPGISALGAQLGSCPGALCDSADMRGNAAAASENSGAGGAFLHPHSHSLVSVMTAETGSILGHQDYNSVLLCSIGSHVLFHVGFWESFRDSV